MLRLLELYTHAKLNFSVCNFFFKGREVIFHQVLPLAPLRETSLEAREHQDLPAILEWEKQSKTQIEFQ